MLTGGIPWYVEVVVGCAAIPTWTGATVEASLIDSLEPTGTLVLLTNIVFALAATGFIFDDGGSPTPVLMTLLLIHVELQLELSTGRPTGVYVEFAILCDGTSANDELTCAEIFPVCGWPNAAVDVGKGIKLLLKMGGHPCPTPWRPLTACLFEETSGSLLRTELPCSVVPIPTDAATILSKDALLTTIGTLAMTLDAPLLANVSLGGTMDDCEGKFMTDGGALLLVFGGPTVTRGCIPSGKSHWSN